MENLTSEKITELIEFLNNLKSKLESEKSIYDKKEELLQNILYYGTLNNKLLYSLLCDDDFEKIIMTNEKYIYNIFKQCNLIDTSIEEKYINSKYVDPKLCNSLGLKLACTQNNIEIVKKFLQDPNLIISTSNKADYNVIPTQSNYCIHHVIGNHKIDILELLLNDPRLNFTEDVWKNMFQEMKYSIEYCEQLLDRVKNISCKTYYYILNYILRKDKL